MSIATYSDLKTAIETWLARVGDTKISGNASDIVTLAESYLNRNLPLNQMRTNANLSGSVGSRSLALPSDFYAPISLKLTTFGVETILKPRVAGMFVQSLVNGVPRSWVINGSNIDLDYPCDQAHTFVFRYQKKFALSDSSTTNWLLTNFPDAYLTTCLMQAEILTQSWQNAAMRKQMLNEMIEEIADIDAKTMSIGTLSMDNAMLPVAPFNINSGQPN